MKRRVVNILTVWLAAIRMVACSSAKVIPQKDLEQIFREFYLTNAYLSSKGGNIRQDSMDVYRPILEKYGYTVEDLQSTFESFSRRKSSKLSAVVDKAVSSLDSELEFYRYELSGRDSLQARALRWFSSVIFEDSSLRAQRIRDTADLRLVLPVREGTYEVSYAYFVDSADLNRGLRTTYSMRNGLNRQTGAASNSLVTRRWSRHMTRIDARQGDSILMITFGNYPAKDLKKPDLRIDSLRLVYFLPPQQAMDSLYYQWGGFKLDADDLYRPEDIQADSFPLYPLPGGPRP